MKLSGHQSIAEPWSFSQNSFCSRRRSLASMQTSRPPSNLRAFRGLRQSVGCWGGRALLFFTDVGIERGRDLFLKPGPTSAASVGCCAVAVWPLGAGMGQLCGVWIECRKPGSAAPALHSSAQLQELVQGWQLQKPDSALLTWFVTKWDVKLTLVC